MMEHTEEEEDHHTRYIYISYCIDISIYIFTYIFEQNKTKTLLYIHYTHKTIASHLQKSNIYGSKKKSSTHFLLLTPRSILSLFLSLLLAIKTNSKTYILLVILKISIKPGVTSIILEISKTSYKSSRPRCLARHHHHI